jgi:LPS sulfotransferase NodH
VLCGYARTGGSLLAEALKATGRLGDPQEYFNPDAIVVAPGESYPRDAPAQLAEIARRGVTPNGIYGLKLFCDQFDDLGGFDWASRLPDLHFVHLERRDILGQAISWVRAMQSVQWNSTQPQRGELRYDAAAIEAALGRFALHRARWAMFFARNAISPLNLVYEDMIAAMPQTVQAIGALVGIDDVPGAMPVPGQLEVQRDAISEEWRARFVAARRDLAMLDRPHLARRPRWLQRLWRPS